MYHNLKLLPNQIYHIFNHAVGQENLFYDENDYLNFLSKYKLHIAPIGCTIAYCLMPNHFHCLVKIKDSSTLKEYYIEQYKKKVVFDNALNEAELVSSLVSKSFSNLFNSYTQSFNYKKKRKGSLFRQNFKRKHVNDETYLKYLVSYIHNNPLKDNFVDSLQEWEFSSYHALTHVGEKEGLIGLYGGLEEFVSYHENHFED